MRSLTAQPGALPAPLSSLAVDPRQTSVINPGPGQARPLLPALWCHSALRPLGSARAGGKQDGGPHSERQRGNNLPTKPGPASAQPHSARPAPLGHSLATRSVGLPARLCTKAGPIKPRSRNCYPSSTHQSLNLDPHQLNAFSSRLGEAALRLGEPPARLGVRAPDPRPVCRRRGRRRARHGRARRLGPARRPAHHRQA